MFQQPLTLCEIKMDFFVHAGTPPPNYSKLNRAGSGIIGSYSIYGPRATLNNWGGGGEYSTLLSHRLVYFDDIDPHERQRMREQTF